MGEDEKNLGVLEFSEALSKVQFEHILISHRMLWLFSSQGFFIAAYFALTSQSFGNVPGKDLYLDLIPSMAAILSLLIYSSIVAAHVAIGRWKKLAKVQHRTSLISTFWIHYFGDAPASVTSILFVGFWASIITIDKRKLLQGDIFIMLIPLGVVVFAGVLWGFIVRRHFRISVEY